MQIHQILSESTNAVASHPQPKQFVIVPNSAALLCIHFRCSIDVLPANALGLSQPIPQRAATAEVIGKRKAMAARPREKTDRTVGATESQGG